MYLTQAKIAIFSQRSSQPSRASEPNYEVNVEPTPGLVHKVPGDRLRESELETGTVHLFVSCCFTRPVGTWRHWTTLDRGAVSSLRGALNFRSKSFR